MGSVVSQSLGQGWGGGEEARDEDIVKCVQLPLGSSFPQLIKPGFGCMAGRRRVRWHVRTNTVSTKCEQPKSLTHLKSGCGCMAGSDCTRLHRAGSQSPARCVFSRRTQLHGEGEWSYINYILGQPQPEDRNKLLVPAGQRHVPSILTLKWTTQDDVFLKPSAAPNSETERSERSPTLWPPLTLAPRQRCG